MIDKLTSRIWVRNFFAAHGLTSEYLAGSHLRVGSLVIQFTAPNRLVLTANPPAR
jgi:hypothetical protein